MERLMFIRFCLLLMIISSCTSQKHYLTKDSLKNAYQIFYNKSDFVCLMIYDKWGEENNIQLYDNGLKLISEGLFKIDPLPRIISIMEDTIILDYKLNKRSPIDSLKSINYNPMNYLPETYSKLGKFKIKYQYSYGIEGNSMGDTVHFDNFKIDKELFAISFFNNQKEVKKISISELYFENGQIEFVEMRNSIEVYHILEPIKTNLVDEFYSNFIKIYDK